ncbi:ATP-binding protein [Streptomyces sp. NPDC058467]|uniref:ATP-binding protein n=1 Tax=unclassified Streptomyces TaxID=2593676 RepID=UPI00366686ED
MPSAWIIARGVNRCVGARTLTSHQGDAVSSPAHQAPRLPGTAAPLTERTAPPDALRRGTLSSTSTSGELTRQEPSRDPSRTAVLRLIGTTQGCAQARDFTHRTLANWALDHCSADALTVVAELAANAVVHAMPHARAGMAGVWLKLTLRPAHLVCAVIDSSDSPPVYPCTSDPLDEHGRGLRMVDALSEHWGWTWRYPSGRTVPEGKTVWAMLPTRPRT